MVTGSRIEAAVGVRCSAANNVRSPCTAAYRRCSIPFQYRHCKKFSTKLMVYIVRRGRGKEKKDAKTCFPFSNMKSIENSKMLNAKKATTAKSQINSDTRSNTRKGLALITFLSSRKRLTFVCITSPCILCGRKMTLLLLSPSIYHKYAHVLNTR